MQPKEQQFNKCSCFVSDNKKGGKGVKDNEAKDKKRKNF